VLASCDVSNFEIVAAIACLAQQTADGSAMTSRNDIYHNYCKQTASREGKSGSFEFLERL